jgi:ElaB/YqjD/DUF883 family membrane-anchored ribosome-binding protein
MPAAAVEPIESQRIAPKSGAAERVAEAARRVVHASHEAHLLKTIAEDALEDGLYAAKRAVKNVHRRLDDLGDVKDEAVRRVKRQPLLTVGIAFGVGAVVGVLGGWLAGRGVRRV